MAIIKIKFKENGKLIKKKGFLRILSLLILAVIIFVAIILISWLEKEGRQIMATKTSISDSFIKNEISKTITKGKKMKGEKILKVRFWSIDRQNLRKKEFLGTAILKNGKLTINIKDEKLKKILQKPYTTMAGKVKGGIARDWFITYQPGTIQHLKAIATECWQWGFISEIEENP